MLVNSGGEYHTFLPDRRPTRGELLWKGVGTLYEVDMGLHWVTGLEFDLPSREEEFLFHAVVDVEWRVIDPERIVSDGVNDIREALSPALRHRLGEIARQFYVEDAATAEEKALESLTDPEKLIGAEYGLWSRVFLQMRMDEPTITHAAAIREVRREIELENKTQMLRLLREESTSAVIARRIERYREIMINGEYDQFALQIAQNPDEVANVVQMLRQERHENRRNVTDFVTRLLDSGAIERHEINDQVVAALRWLQEATDTVLLGPEQPPRIAGQCDTDPPLPLTDLPESSLPNKPPADSVRPPADGPPQGPGKP